MGKEEGLSADMEFKIGDNVKVVKYGALMWKWKKNYQEESDYFAKAQIEFNNSMSEMLFGESAVKEDSSNAKGKSEPDNIYLETKDMWWIDTLPSIVGQEGVVCQVTNSQGRLKYAIDGIKGKHAWYNGEQLEICRS